MTLYGVDTRSIDSLVVATIVTLLIAAVGILLLSITEILRKRWRTAYLRKHYPILFDDAKLQERLSDVYLKGGRSS